MTLEEIRASLLRVAVEHRRNGISCCAQQAEILALRLTEAIEADKGDES